MKSNSVLSLAHRFTKAYGFQPLMFANALKSTPRFLNEMRKFRKHQAWRSFEIEIAELWPCMNEYRCEAGTASGHYFHQDLWFARKIYALRPARHIDIGSRIDGFIAHLLVFMEVTILDIQPLESKLAGLNYMQEDATELSTLKSDSIESISCLHAAEHFGLGRYSDPICPSAPELLAKSLARVLRPGGALYFSVPIGRERLSFNSQRTFLARTILELFPTLHLVDFAFVDDNGDLRAGCSPAEADGLGLEQGCGLFHFTRTNVAP